MSKLQFNCNNCGEMITAAAEQKGFVTYCPNCQAELIVPDTDSREIFPPPASSNDPAEILREVFAAGDDNPFEHDSASQVLQRAIKPRLEQGRPVPPASTDSQPQGESFQEPAEDSDEQIREDIPPLPDMPAEALRQQETSVLPAPEENNDIVETEVYDPNALSGRSHLEEGYFEAHAGRLHIDSDVHAHAHTNQIAHTHHLPYTYNGIFQPFSDDALNAVLNDENPDTIAGVRSIQAGPSVWPCGVFAVLLNSRIMDYLPEQLPLIDMPYTMFGSVDKVLPVFRDLQLSCLEILHNICDAFGADFFYALEHHDLYQMVNCIRKLDNPFQDFYEFMLDVQEMSLPRKDPLPFLRELVLSWYPQVRNRIIDVSYRLDYRSHLTPEQAQMSTINVSIIPAALHRFNLELQNIPRT